LPIADFRLPIENHEPLSIGNWQSASAMNLPGALFVSFTRAGAERAALIALAQLAACAATLQSLFVRTQAGLSIHGKHAFNFSMGSRNNVNAD
jgi:hypothetical protein